jgi:3-keto-5-aminohexanoate cleavage enzyme
LFELAAIFIPVAIIVVSVFSKLESKEKQMNKVMITAAISGAETTREHQPNLPITPQEMAQAAKACRQAGASILHMHVRDDQGNPDASVARFEECYEAIRKETDIVVEFTTGGAIGMSDQDRLAPVELKPQMASHA